MSSRLFKAVDFATAAHSGQFRKGTTIPYVVHPLSVAKRLSRVGIHEDVVVAGILHDVVEDTDTTFADIERDFGARVAELVAGVSDKDKSESWESRKSDALAKVKDTEDLDLLTLKCADKLDNLSDILADYRQHGEELWQRFKRGKKAQAWYYQSIAQVMNERLAGEPGEPLAKELAETCKLVFG